MNNNKTTNILLGILIVVLVAIGIIMATNQNRNSYRNDMMRNDHSMMDNDNRNDISTPVKSNPTQQVSTITNSKDVNWDSVPISTIENLAKKANLSMEGDLRLSTESYDLTGDGSIEGIYSFSSGNSDTTIIALANSDGTTSLAILK